MSTDSTGTPADVQEFAAFLERYHTDVALRHLHVVRVVMGSFFAVLVVVWNYFRLHGQGADERVTRIATMVCAVHVLACLVTLVLAQRSFIAALTRDATTMRERAWKVAQFVHRRSNILLLLAFTGQVLVLAGTLFRLHLFAADGEVLLVALVPTVLLLVHGLGEIPTRERLCRLYARLTASAQGTMAAPHPG
jgi:hypothetical protein